MRSHSTSEFLLEFREIPIEYQVELIESAIYARPAKGRMLINLFRIYTDLLPFVSSRMIPIPLYFSLADIRTPESVCQNYFGNHLEQYLHYPELELFNLPDLESLVEYNAHDIDAMRANDWEQVRAERITLFENEVTRCIEIDDVDALDRIVAIDNDIQSPQHLKTTPVQYAAQMNAFRCFRYLVINRFDLTGAMKNALASGHPEMLKILEEHDIEYPTDSLEIAVRHFQGDVIEWLFREKPDLCTDKHILTALSASMSCTNIRFALEYIDSFMYASNNNSEAVFNEAAMNGRPIMCALGICHGADVDKFEGILIASALHWAAECAPLPVVQMLVSAGASIDLVDPYLETPLDWAECRFMYDNFAYLCAHGARLDHYYKRGLISTHQMSTLFDSNQTDLIRRLLGGS